MAIAGPIRGAVLFCFALSLGAGGYCEEPVTSSTRLTNAQLDVLRDGMRRRACEHQLLYLERPFFELPRLLEEDALAQAQWIWRPGERGRTSAPIGVRFFRRSVEIPADRQLKGAYCALAGDNTFVLFVNGSRVGQGGGFARAKLFDIGRWLRPGGNTVTVRVENAGSGPNPAGLLAAVQIDFTSGSPLVLPSDAGWRVCEPAPDADPERNKSIRSTAETKGVPASKKNELPETDERWTASEELGVRGSAPWGRTGYDDDVLVTLYAFSRLTFALSAMYLQGDDCPADVRASAADMQRANAAILDAARQIRGGNRSLGEFGLHWMGAILYRIYALFGPDGLRQQVLSTQAAETIERLFADWARTESRISDASPNDTWRIWGSENHSAQRDATAWAAAKILCEQSAQGDFRYADGSKPDEQLAAWQLYLREYFRERVKRGLLIEISPSGYGSRTLQGWHNIYDFTNDRQLKTLAKAALDVWWADWAQEQIDGMRGGGKTRLYPGVWALSSHDRNRAMSWFYLGQGRPAHQHETLAVVSTTTYRLPPVVMDIALNRERLGVYECKSRRPGRDRDPEYSKSLSTPETPVYAADAEFGGILRYSYCTPDFIMGSLMFEQHPLSYWTKISAQNRWHGVIFAGRPDSVLYPRCLGDPNTYNGQWAIQNRGTMIAQKQRTSADNVRNMRVCFSEDLEREEYQGWILAKAARAFAAVKVVRGGFHWADSRWLQCDDEYSPVIIESVRQSDFESYEQFKQCIGRQEVVVSDEEICYQGLRGSGRFTFYWNSDRPPLWNDRPFDLAPNYTFSSPFMNQAWASGLVRITKGDRELVIDVREVVD